MFCPSTSPSASLSGPIVIEPTLSSFGDWVWPPPGRPTKVSAARYCTAPTAMMLIATPEMMWSTPKTTVAVAWIRPPMAPISSAPATPAQAP